MSKKIIVKMRNIKKILGNEMLQLAIMLSLMRVDPEFMLFPGGSGNNMDNYDASDAFPGKKGNVMFNLQYLGVDPDPHANDKESDSSLDNIFVSPSWRPVERGHAHPEQLRRHGRGLWRRGRRLFAPSPPQEHGRRPGAIPGN